MSCSECRQDAEKGREERLPLRTFGHSNGIVAGQAGRGLSDVVCRATALSNSDNWLIGIF